MKTFTLSFIASSAGLLLRKESQQDTPITQVVTLIKELKTRIEQDGQHEQGVYDKFACWCEDTTTEKANAIDLARNLIEELTSAITKLSGQQATLTAEIDQLNKDIQTNKDSVREATEVRQTERADYNKSSTESAQCIGALEHAIGVLTGAGSSSNHNAGLLETQVLSVANGIRKALHLLPPGKFTFEQIETIRSFIDKPSTTIGHMSAHPQLKLSQVKGKNPFGNYAPQSTEIQGILKDMYDTFIRDAEGVHGEEGKKEQMFASFTRTKAMEADALNASLVAKENQLGESTYELAASKQFRTDVKKQLQEDEEFFADTKTQCKTKAVEWNERSRMRTEELGGIDEAVTVLESGGDTFGSAYTTFAQTKLTHQITASKAYNALKKAAEGKHSLRIAAIAVSLKTGGAFDEVVGQIENMITVLRKEEAEDLKHRDWCQAEENKKANQENDLMHSIDNAEARYDRLDAKSQELGGFIQETDGAIITQTDDMGTALNLRNSENATFKQALIDDQKAVELIQTAIQHLSKFYANNKLQLAQQTQDPEYHDDPKKAPETWDKGYGGRKSEHKGVIAILQMLVEDLQKEIKEGSRMEKEALAAYQHTHSEANKALNGLKSKKSDLEREKADIDMKMADVDDDKNNLIDAKNGKGDEIQALGLNCEWVSTTFQSRRDTRKTEIEGLIAAKNILMGSEQDAFGALP